MYALRFLVVLGLGSALTITVARPAEAALRSATEWAVLTLVPWVGLEGMDVGAHELLFLSQTAAFSYRLVEECAGWNVLLFFGSAVIVYPAPVKRRLIGLAVGLPALAVVNVLRLVFLALVGVHLPGWFDPVHDIGWPVFQLGGIVALTLVWMRWAARGPSHPVTESPRRRPAGPVPRAWALAAAGLALMLSPVPAWYARTLSTLVALFAAGWAGGSSVSVGDLQVYGRPRFLALWIAACVVWLVQSRLRTHRRVLLIVCVVMCVHLIEGLVSVAYLAGSTGGEMSTPAWEALFDVVHAGIYLLVLREIRRSRPNFMRPVRLPARAAR